MSNIYGLLGEKLSHSISPEIHNAIFNMLNIDGCYHLFEVDKISLKDAVFGLKALRAVGVNVTIPYKIDVMEYMDEISPEACGIGSINTISFYNGKIKGYNTDYYGFGMMLDRYGVSPKNKKVVILGNGGVTKAICRYLADNGVSNIIIVSRRASQAVEDTSIISYEDLNNITGWDIIINCTPCGMYPSVGDAPVEKHIIGRYNAAIDLIYNPKETLFLKYAAECGIKAVNGLYMLVGQAVKSNEIWNGIKIKSNVIEEVYIRAENCKHLD